MRNQFYSQTLMANIRRLPISAIKQIEKREEGVSKVADMLVEDDL
jgi:hypothetical protein